MNPPIQKELFVKYRALQRKIQEEIITDRDSREQLITHCAGLIAQRKSLAKISNHYTNNVRGFNAKLSETILTCLDTGDWSTIELDPNILKMLEPYVYNVSAIQRIETYREQAREIENQILTQLQPLAVFIAMKYASRTFGIDRKDTIQEASKGILRAIEKYDPNFQGKAAKFSTYAYNSAQKKVQEFVMNHSRLVKLPKTKLERIFLLIEASNAVPNNRNETVLATAANRKLKKRHNRPLTDKEMFTDEEVAELIVLLYGGSISLDAPVGDRKSLGEAIADERDTAEEEILNAASKKYVQDILKSALLPVEYSVIYYKFFYQDDEISLGNVQTLLAAQNVELSRERINQIKLAALKKLRDNYELEEIFGGNIR